MWTDDDDAVIGGDLTAALGYCTPAGGVVVAAVAPFGIRDREAGTVSFTTSLGFGRKLDRMSRNPRVALAFYAREHGFTNSARYVLLQGTASFESTPDAAVLDATVWPASVPFIGPMRTGVLWGRWLDAYYSDRVLVTVHVERVLAWPDLACSGQVSVTGRTLPCGASDPPGQAAPKKGTGPRIDAERAGRRLRRLPHALVGYRGSDGFPMIVAVEVGASGPEGLQLSGPLPAGGRRAGLLGHRYEPSLIGLEMRQYTGWLADGRYAPHTEQGFRAPANNTLLLLGNGVMARRGLRRARALGRVG
jgi:hypothetical protein